MPRKKRSRWSVSQVRDLLLSSHDDKARGHLRRSPFLFAPHDGVCRPPFHSSVMGSVAADAQETPTCGRHLSVGGTS